MQSTLSAAPDVLANPDRKYWSGQAQAPSPMTINAVSPAVAVAQPPVSIDSTPIYSTPTYSKPGWRDHSEWLSSQAGNRVQLGGLLI